MTLVYLSSAGLMLGMAAVSSSPAAHFAALGLVVVAGSGCVMLATLGGSLLCLVLFLIYLGGMLVVFAYSSALAADPYPEAWGQWAVMQEVINILLWTGVLVWFLMGEWYPESWVVADEGKGLSVVRGDTSGVAMMYDVGGGMLLLCGGALLLTLLVVFELTRGLGRGSLRTV